MCHDTVARPAQRLRRHPPGRQIPLSPARSIPQRSCFSFTRAVRARAPACMNWSVCCHELVRALRFALCWFGRRARRRPGPRAVSGERQTKSQAPRSSLTKTERPPGGSGLRRPVSFCCTTAVAGWPSPEGSRTPVAMRATTPEVKPFDCLSFPEMHPFTPPQSMGVASKLNMILRSVAQR